MLCQRTRFASKDALNMISITNLISRPDTVRAAKTIPVKSAKTSRGPRRLRHGLGPGAIHQGRSTIIVGREEQGIAYVTQEKVALIVNVVKTLEGGYTELYRTRTEPMIA